MVKVGFDLQSPRDCARLVTVSLAANVRVALESLTLGRADRLPAGVVLGVEGNRTIVQGGAVSVVAT